MAVIDRLQGALSDRYRIERELGRGGMATVYLAEDLKHHRRVGIKVLDPEVTAAVGPERFLREIEIAARLTHPHILPVYDSGSAGGLLYYVMPYVEGESLRQRLERQRQLPVEETVGLAREVADALDEAHRQGVVHRDIKPENILLEGSHAVVADFGIARAIAAAGGEALTQTGVAVGTPAYMSPEQASGSGRLDGRSDQYALACVVYEMLAGQPPFTGATTQDVVRQHLTAGPRAVTVLRPGVPQAMERGLAKALAKTPADRFATTGEFAAALGLAEAGVPAAVRPRTWRSRALAGLAIVVVAAVALWAVRGRRAASPVPTHPRTDIAVLPLQNLSVGGPYAYFAGGLHEELLTQLAKVAALKVISRTSVMGYSGTTKPLKQIADELGVGAIVEGSVQVAGERLRVNVQLIDAATDEHLWAERYDRTLDDAFAIQSDVAQRIVAAVGVALGAEERQGIDASPTANPEAYRLYLQGEDYRRRPGGLRPNLESATRVYEGALALDPDFALAHAMLSLSQGQMYWSRYDPSPARAARQREEAEAALRLAPELPQAHLAMGMAHYWGRRDYRRALHELRIALRGLPNDADLWFRVGTVNRRLGNWAAVDSAYQRAIQLDPRNADFFADLGGMTFWFLRRYRDAMPAFDRARALAPDMGEAAVSKGQTYFAWKGELDTLHAVLDALPRDSYLGASGSAEFCRAYLLLLERASDRLLALLGESRESLFTSQSNLVPAASLEALAHRMRGDERAAKAAYESALTMLDSVVVALPGDTRVHAARGLALAGLGRRQEALREAEWLQRSAVYREDHFDGRTVVEDRARILAQAGEPDAAIDEIERLLAEPSWLSVHMLRLDPHWDSLRDHPRFKALLVKYADPERTRR